jgi:hypothetical protein
MRALRSPARGFSLQENLFATGLFMLVGLLGAQLLTPCLHIFNFDQVQASLDETALITSRSIEKDVLPSDLNSITTTTQGFSFLVGSGYSPSTGVPIWNNFVVYYQQGSCLWRKTWVPPGMPMPTMTTARMSSAQLVQAINTPNGSEHVVAQNLANATFTLGTTLQVTGMLQAPGQSSTISFQVLPRQ